MSNAVAESRPASLKSRGRLRLLMTFVVLGALLFLPGGSFRFWQAWLYLLIMEVSWTFFFLSFFKTDPQLLERRLRHQESDPAQRIFQKFSNAIIFSGFLLAGLDFRWGWTRASAPIPLVVVLTAQILALVSYCIVFWVMKTNTFASSTIQIEAGHTVIRNGPYAFVRHPMYTGMALAMISTPIALGSCIALAIFALEIPALVYRLINEERMLRRDLLGYSDYCESVRFRLLPGIW